MTTLQNVMDVYFFIYLSPVFICRLDACYTVWLVGLGPFSICMSESDMIGDARVVGGGSSGGGSSGGGSGGNGEA